jgi:serine/threonine protein kinase
MLQRGSQKMDIYDLTQATVRTILSDSNDHDVVPFIPSSVPAAPELDIADVWQFVLNDQKLDRFKPSKFKPTRTVYGIGEGACYRVDKGELNQIGGGQLIAIKYLKLTERPSGAVDSGESNRSIDMVLRELRILTHNPIRECANIVRLLGYGSRTVGEVISLYLVAEFAAHGTLQDFLSNKKTDKKVSITQKIGFCSDITKGLAALHACGVAQGDMKLENTLVCISENGEPIAKLSDFGHSILDDESRYIGTANFNAPEVRSGRRVSTLRADHYKCDIFSYGLMVWEIVQGGRRYVDPRHRKDPITWLAGLPKDDLLRMALLATQELLPADAAKISLLHKVLESTLRDDAEDRSTVQGVLKIFNLERAFAASEA